MVNLTWVLTVTFLRIMFHINPGRILGARHPVSWHNPLSLFSLSRALWFHCAARHWAPASNTTFSLFFRLFDTPGARGSSSKGPGVIAQDVCVHIIFVMYHIICSILGRPLKYIKNKKGSMLYYTNIFYNALISSSALIRKAGALTTVIWPTGGNTENEKGQTQEKCPCCEIFWCHSVYRGSWTRS